MFDPTLPPEKDPSLGRLVLSRKGVMTPPTPKKALMSLSLRDMPQAKPPQLPEVVFSWRGRLCLVLCSLLAILGLVQQSWIFLLAGLGGWIACLMMLLQFRVDLRQGLEHDGFEGAFVTLPGGTCRAGYGGEVAFRLTGNRRCFLLHQVNAHHSAYLDASYHDKGPAFALKPNQPFELVLSLDTPVAGRFMLHGVELHLEDQLSLFRTTRYVHCPSPLRVLPAMPLSRGQRQGRKVQLFSHPQRGAPQKRPGTGSDLRDIREYRPGDARRLIAWKHSLRHRKLLCREFESESPISTYLLLDIGQSMREGEPGKRKLDYGSEVISAFTKSAIEERDSIGFISFDGKLYQHLPLGFGNKQFQALLRHLGDLHQIVDRDFAHITLGSLCHLVSQFLWEEQVLSGVGGRAPAHSRQTVEFIWDYIHQHPDLKLPKEWESDQDLIDEVLRMFCQHAGIELPYRYRQWVTYKAAGLRMALEEATNRLQGGQLLVVVSDLGDILHWDGIMRALRRARQKRHHVIFLSPFSPWFTERGHTPHSQKEREEQEVLADLLTLEQWTWRKRIQKLLAPLGIPVLSLDAETAPAALLERLRRLRSSGRW